MCSFLREKRRERIYFGEQRRLSGSGSRKQQFRLTHSLLRNCLLVLGAKKTLAAEEMQRKGEYRNVLIECVQIGMSPI